MVGSVQPDRMGKEAASREPVASPPARHRSAPVRRWRAAARSVVVRISALVGDARSRPLPPGAAASGSSTILGDRWGWRQRDRERWQERSTRSTASRAAGSRVCCWPAGWRPRGRSWCCWSRGRASASAIGVGCSRGEGRRSTMERTTTTDSGAPALRRARRPPREGEWRSGTTYGSSGWAGPRSTTRPSWCAPARRTWRRRRAAGGDETGRSRMLSWSRGWRRPSGKPVLRAAGTIPTRHLAPGPIRCPPILSPISIARSSRPR